MKIRGMLLLSTIIASPAGCLLMGEASSAWAQQPSGGPDAKLFPDGGRLQAEYTAPNQPLSVPKSSERAVAAVASLAASAAAQANLPPDFTLLTGATTEVDVPGNRQAAAAGGTSLARKFVTLHPIAYRGIPLSKGSDYLTIVGGDNRLLVERKRGLPTSVDTVTPTVPAAAAVTAARKDAGQGFANANAGDTIPKLEVWVDDHQAGHLAWTFVLASGTAAKPDVRRFWVAATDQSRVLHAETEIYNAEFGEVSANIWSTSPFATPPTQNRPLADLTVSRDSDGATVTTAIDGKYGFTTTTGGANISAQLSGSFAAIQNQAGPTSSVSQTGSPSTATNLNFGAGTEADLAQTSGFYWTTFVHELAQNYIPAGGLANLPVKTNIAATCNAFWDGASLNFFSAGGGCPNTAYSDVVMHEFGHGIDAANGGIIDGGYSEGFGDSVALLGSRQPCIGRDFFGAGTCLRPATDVVLWPPPAGDEVHDIGRRYAGFSWELVQQLKHTYSDDEAFSLAAHLILGSGAANPSDIPDAVRLSFVVDAPDGNPAHGSPHFRELAAAADSRNIPRPPDPLMADGAVSASAAFPWTPPQTVNVNSNILQASIHLDRPSAVHVSANSSATSPTPIAFETGFYTDPNPSIMWTNSYRNVSLPTVNQWGNFGSSFATNLPAGDYTLYWKVWVTGGPVTLSAGTLLVEAFSAPGSSVAIASAGQGEQSLTTTPVTAALAVNTKDQTGQAVTRAAQAK